MKAVGLTGGIGSGKTLVSNIFAHLGIPVFNADAESKIMLDEDLSIKAVLTKWFGQDIYCNGRLDRQKLAGIIFSDTEELSRVNRIVHPRVMDRFLHWCNDYKDIPYVIHEAAILFESGFYLHMNTTILVTAPENIRIARVRQRDKATEESTRQRMRSQWTDEQKSPLAGFIIVNDGESPLLPKVLEIHSKLIC
jgi:dephospho-CoA kinase